MQKELVQKRGFTKREAKIMETKVVYKSTLFGKEFEVSIPYENLSRHKDSYLLNRKNFYIPVIALGFLTFVTFMWRNDKDLQNDLGEYQWIIWGGFFLISTSIYLLSIENLWRIRVHYNTYLYFFKSIPNKKVVDDFLEFLFEMRDNYLKETYFYKPNKNLSFESQINNLQWLRKNEVISASEFKNRMKELEEVFNQEQTKIGFN
ncbi:hypothetical protein B0I03_101448 [Flavobacterium aquaticum]|uniref:Uncharacterized protein n=2 Tax=Flavobacterium aquaticum TaxID=1236486 RepID=A0A327YWA0_9FLAO|nr:hypothetical protein B0I03_101448 [Flavobacterium aquaticum]